MLTNQTILEREIQGLKGFFIFWYIQGPVWIWQRIFITISNFESIFSVRLMFKNLDKPIFQDYTRAGRILGFLIRLLRIFAGLIFYLLTFVIFIGLEVLWLFLPIIAVWQIARLI